ncbi:MAG: DUF1294 domain-containing protein [Lachnospiraceae bacterium]
MPLSLFYIYLLLINLVSVALTLYDKRAAQRHRWRVRERTLLLIAAIGGAPAMLVTMQLVRHKTQHLKFMVGLPVILIVQIILAALFWAHSTGLLTL